MSNVSHDFHFTKNITSNEVLTRWHGLVRGAARALPLSVRKRGLDTHRLFLALAQPGLRPPAGLGPAGATAVPKRRTKVTAGAWGVKGVTQRRPEGLAWVPVAPSAGAPGPRAAQQVQGGEAPEPRRCAAASSPGRLPGSRPDHIHAQLKTVPASTTPCDQQSPRPLCPLLLTGA